MAKDMVLAEIDELSSASQLRDNILLKKEILLKRLTRTVENLATLAVLRLTEQKETRGL